MTYNLTLANIAPAATAFKVLINSVAMAVNAVAVSGTKVQLTLASGVKYGDVVTVSYTKPVSNPLQTATGGQPISITAQTTINNVINPVKDATPGVITMTISPNHIHRIINVILQYSSSYSILDPAMSPQILRIFNTSGKLLIEKLLVTGVANIKMPINLRFGYIFCSGIFRWLATGFTKNTGLLDIYYMTIDNLDFEYPSVPLHSITVTEFNELVTSFAHWCFQMTNNMF